MVELRYMTRAGAGVCRSVPDTEIEKATLGMYRARIECEVFNEHDELVGEVRRDRQWVNGRWVEFQAWWDPEPNPQEQIDEREAI